MEYRDTIATKKQVLEKRLLDACALGGIINQGEVSHARENRERPTREWPETAGGRSRSHIVVALGLILVAIALAAGCAGDSDAGESTEAQAPAAAQPAASPPETGPAKPCEPGLDIEEQKRRLIAIASSQFSGVTAHNPELSRLHYDPDARVRRQGGLWVVVEFNGDEYESIPRMKAELDTRMRDAYEALYAAGCGDLVLVDLAARSTAVAVGGIKGGVVQAFAVVFKTRMSLEVADSVDWTAKDSLDFNEIWETLLLNVRWKKELEGE